MVNLVNGDSFDDVLYNLEKMMVIVMMMMMKRRMMMMMMKKMKMMDRDVK